MAEIQPKNHQNVQKTHFLQKVPGVNGLIKSKNIIGLKVDSLTAEILLRMNRPRSIYQYSNMAPRLSGQISIFGVVFFVSKSLLGIEGQRKLEKFAILTQKPRSHARILIYRTWPIETLSVCTLQYL